MKYTVQVDSSDRTLEVYVEVDEPVIIFHFLLHSSGEVSGWKYQCHYSREQGVRWYTTLHGTLVPVDDETIPDLAKFYLLAHLAKVSTLFTLFVLKVTKTHMEEELASKGITHVVS